MPTPDLLKSSSESSSNDYFGHFSFSIMIWSWNDNTFIRFRGSLETIPDFRPKRLKNHTLWGCTCLYSWYRGVPPLPPPPAEIFHLFLSPHSMGGTYVSASVMGQKHNSPLAVSRFIMKMNTLQNDIGQWLAPSNLVVAHYTLGTIHVDTVVMKKL